MSEQAERLRRVVRQHAETSRLFGVDFVPVYSSADQPMPEREADPQPAPSADPAGATPVRRTPTSDPEQNRKLLDELRRRYEEEAPHQHFVTDHNTIVFGEGDPCARLMFIGEAPGADEDRLGRPFVGRAGQLLNKMITAMGLQREQVYITNILKTRPPNNATPTTDETSLCAPYVFEQIRIIHPEVIVTLGLPASRTILATNESMGRMRGRWGEFRHGDLVVPVMPTYHPAFLLRQYTTDNRNRVWSDLRQVMQRLGIDPRKKGR